MTNKIVLNTKRSKDFYVVAKTTAGENSDVDDHREGNVVTPAGTTIKWVVRNDARVALFTVNFFRLSDGTATWPFMENEDGTGTAPAGYVGPLTLTPASAVRLTTKDSGEDTVKYEVTATPSGNVTIEKCDPMIIVRNRNAAKSNVSFGVTCAVLGAAAGALLTALLTSR